MTPSWTQGAAQCLVVTTIREHMAMIMTMLIHCIWLIVISEISSFIALIFSAFSLCRYKVGMITLWGPPTDLKHLMLQYSGMYLVYRPICTLFVLGTQRLPWWCYPVIPFRWGGHHRIPISLCILRLLLRVHSMQWTFLSLSICWFVQHFWLFLILLYQCSYYSDHCLHNE